MTKLSVFAFAAALLGLMPQGLAADGAGHCFADFAETRGYTLGTPKDATPTPDGKAVLYLKSGPRDSDQRLYGYDIAARQERELITPEQVLGGKTEQLSAEEKARRERERVSAHGFVWFQLSPDGKDVLVSQGGRLFVVERADAKVTALPGSDWIAPKFSPDGKKIAALKDDDIHIIDIAAGTDTEITFGANDALTHGEAEFVAQEEMDRGDGLWWSPDSKSIAYEEADLSPVEVHYIADPLHPEEKPVAFRYPRAGTANAIVRLGVIAATGGKTVWVPWDNANAAYPYLVRVTWDKGGPLTLVVENRALTEEEIFAADAATGTSKLLWTERDAAWLELPEADFPRWLPDGSGFLWASERSGLWQLERHARDGKLTGAITPKGFLFDHLADVDIKSASAVVVGGSDRLSLQIWRLPLSGGKPVNLAAARGVNDASFGLQHAIFVHSYNLADGVAGSDLRDRNGSMIAALPSSSETPPYIPKVEYMTVGPLGFDAMVIRPRDFDPAKHYPVILSEYAGPAAKEVWAAPRDYFNDQCMADQGFVVATLDNRGTPGRDRAFLRAVKGDAIDIPLEDQADGLKAIGARVPQMDLKRAGVMGWSFGGYFAAMATMRRPDVFAAGVAGAPVVQWEDYDTYYTERYMQDPAGNADGYKKSNVLSYVDQLQRPLLIVHGVTDDNVYFQNTMQLILALLKAGKTYDLMLLPGTHMLADPSLRQRESERVIGFFKEHLGEPE
jgi:dipeptidyl-peptidase 4